MAIIKSFTSLNQSKKLSKILPPESADQSWASIGIDIPCWSLAALLDVLPKSGKYEPFIDIRYNRIEYHAVDDEVKDEDYLLCYVDGCSLLDACYKMILKLHELNLL